MREHTFKLTEATLLEGQQQPWELLKSGFEPNPPIPSLICVHERKFLHYLTKYHFVGKGAIVDLGPLAGVRHTHLRLVPTRNNLQL